MIRLITVMLATIFIGGCVANPPLYQWGGYESKLYAGYKDQTKMDELRSGLETHIASMEASGKKVAPGLSAELGTLYLQAGDTAKARASYSRERDAWPESRGLMDAMIKNLDRKNTERAEAVK